jgi:hypothetical protein
VTRHPQLAIKLFREEKFFTERSINGMAQCFINKLRAEMNIRSKICLKWNRNKKAKLKFENTIRVELNQVRILKTIRLNTSKKGQQRLKFAAKFWNGKIFPQ